ncbi:MAG TPA: M14 family zinc carboxypeptidase, partial [Thermoanaerobaculia bacterium]|nr:M14 family zinc carboxypeptidase [Thermoanaerobaculia bacterium]
MKTILSALLLSTCALAAAAQPPGDTAAPPPLLAPLSAGELVPLPALDPAVPSPAAFLGHSLGARFTRSADLRAYLAALDAASPKVSVEEYGESWLGRPLMLAAVSSPENIARLDEIRRERAALADPSRLSAAEREALAERLPAVVWLAYGVHGDEASSPEAAMAAAYVLAAARDGAVAGALDRVVVLIDPSSNPDGRERYVSDYQERRGAEPSPDPAAAEHHPPWPGGRGNHYLFDLNRDWAWGTQPETRARLAAVAAWQPQVYVDLHEMSASETYFFPPSAEPVNPLIDPRVVRWLETFGRGNAAAFDRLGWIYFKAESYDLFYPGYADSYLSFRGAVGMTYEMAGGGRAGLALERPDGSVLTLADRAARHLVASLATVATAAADATRLLRDFVDARAAAAAGPGDLYLWPAAAAEAGALAD